MNGNGVENEPTADKWSEFEIIQRKQIASLLSLK